jgi:dipeptide/tripeptide permease
MIDPRGQRFAATVTTVVLALVLLTGSVWLLAAQAGAFAVGAVAGVAASPYGRFYARAIRPRLRPPDEYEDARPPRFAQGVGLIFAMIGLAGLVAGWTVLGYLAVGAALAAAFLNAAFGICLGCEIYLAYRRTLPRLTEVSR